MEQEACTADATEQRVRDAQAEAAIAEAKAEKAAAEQKVKDQKAKNREKKFASFKKLSKAVRIAIVAVVVVAVIGAAATVPGILNSGRQGVTISEAALKDAVNISKLSTAEFDYNGIAEKIDDRGEVSYYIYYEATAKSGIDMGQIEFGIDQESKVITVSLPAISVSSPVVDESKVEYLPSTADVVLREVIEICKKDVQQELESNPNVRKTAEGNLKATLEALLMPIIGEEGYQLQWETIADAEGSDGNATDE